VHLLVFQYILYLNKNCISKQRNNRMLLFSFFIYKGWNFNFGNTMLDWIQALLE